MTQQIGGNHYNKGYVQHWDWVSKTRLGYLEGCATKYLVRWREKNGLEDLLKAKTYIQKAYAEAANLQPAGTREHWDIKLRSRFLNDAGLLEDDRVLEKKIITLIDLWQFPEDLQFALNYLNKLIEEASNELP